LYIGILEANLNDFPPIVSFFNFGRAECPRDWGENGGFLGDFGGLELGFRFLYEVKIFFWFFFLGEMLIHHIKKEQQKRKINSFKF
jgi:hypothetical protein